MPQGLPELILVAAALFGAAVGSFLNVCIYRLPRPGLSVGRPARSFCPTCGHKIPWYDNLPLLSWILLAGRCRSCRGSISIRYLGVEAFTSMLFVVVVHRQILVDEGSWVGAVGWLVVTSALLVAAFIDIDLRIIPDEVTIGGMHLVGLLVLLDPGIRTRAPEDTVLWLVHRVQDPIRDAGNWLPAFLRTTWGTALSSALLAAILWAAGCLIYAAWRRRFLPDMRSELRDVSLAGWLAALTGVGLWLGLLDPGRLTSPRGYALASCLLGMLAGSGLVYLVGEVGRRVFRKPAMGFGDVKLMGLLGGLAGWSGALAGFFIACVLGSIVGVLRLAIWRDRYLPFGPFLCAGCLFVALWPEAFDAAVAAYLSLFAVTF